jgi:hypothetical protein
VGADFQGSCLKIRISRTIAHTSRRIKLCWHNGIEERHRRLVDRKPGRGEQMLLQQLLKRSQFRRRVAHPERKRGSVDVDACIESISLVSALWQWLAQDDGGCARME